MTASGGGAEPTVPALILGSGITALGMVRCLGRREIPQWLWCREGDLATRSRWARRLPAVPEDGGIPEDFAAALRALELERAVLIPCSDAWTLAVASLPEALGARFPASLSDLRGLERLVDKEKLAEVLSEVDVPHPSTWPIRSADELAAMDEARFEHGFLKPRDSQAFFGHFGEKAFRVKDRDDAVARYRTIREAGLEVVLQEYVPGPARNHVFFEGVRNRRGRIVEAFARRRLRMYPPHFGNSSLMISIDPAEVAPAVKHMERLLAAVDFRGIFSAEFKEDVRDGSFRLLEVNCRPWWYVEFAERSGAAIGTAAYMDALDMGSPAGPAPRTGVHCVYPEYDLAAFRYQEGEPRIPARRWFRPWLGARQAILVADDLKPALHAGLNYLATRIRGRGGARKDPPARQEPPEEAGVRS